MNNQNEQNSKVEKRCKNCIYYAGGEGKKVVCRYPLAFIRPETEEVGCDFFKPLDGELRKWNKK